MPSPALACSFRGMLPGLQKVALRSSAHFSSSVKPWTRDGLYELRTYPVAPSKMKSFLDLTKEKFHLRTAHSELLGYWTAEMGGLSQVVHIWYYESLSKRAAVRAALATDANWTAQYLSLAAPMLQGQDNSLLRPLAVPPLAEVAPLDQGIYELHSIQLRGPSNQWEPLVQSCMAQLMADEGAVVTGAWQTVVGRLNSVELLVRHDTQDGLVQGAEGVQRGVDTLSPVLQSWKTKMLLPVFPPRS